MDRDKNINNYIENVYIVSLSNKDDIIYKIIYLDFHQFELQILRKKIINYIPRFSYIQIFEYIVIEPGHTNTINYIINTVEKDINVIFQYKFLKNIYDLQWKKNDDCTLKITIKSINNDRIASPIKLLLVSNIQNDINNINMKNYTYSTIITSKFKLKKKSSVPDIEKQYIPKVIMQTYRVSNVKNEIYDSSISWLLCNPEYKYEFYDDNRCIQFLKRNFSEDVVSAFNILVPGAYKADLFRYCYLYICGGVYTDIDNICMCNLKNVIKKDDVFISVKDRPTGAIYNAFIATTPKNPIFNNSIDNILHNVKYRIYPKNITSQYNDRYLAITGPLCLGKSLNVFLNRELTHTYEEGEYNINNMKFKLFYLHNSGKYVTYNDKVIFYIKYDGYQTTSNYLTMFNNKTVYKMIAEV